MKNMSSKMTKANNTTLWDQNRGIIRSRKGGWFIGKGVYCHGHEMNKELLGKVSYFQVMILNATGRLVERPLADWLEALYIGLSWPDPRIWCNQIGALAGTMRTSTVAATTAGTLAADSRFYGQGILPEGGRFIQQALIDFNHGSSVEEIVAAEVARNAGRAKIMGFARPIAKGDERLEVMANYTTELGFTVGEHLTLAYQVEKVLIAKHDEVMNIGAFTAAFLSDQNLTPQEMYQICAVLVNSGVTACYVDTFNRPPETFLPMRCNDIDYQGPPPRPVPERD
jgi:citrate synthase